MDGSSSAGEESSEFDARSRSPSDAGAAAARSHRREASSDVSSECSGEPGSPYNSPPCRPWPTPCRIVARPEPLLKRLGAAPRGGAPDRRATEDELQLMKERFSRLLLGEDMSGSGKGVSTAVTISNAITNLYATAFGSCHRLEPLPVEKKAMWRREMDCLLSICDYIVEFFPSSEISPDGTVREVMATRPRPDIYINLPALEKLDDMLLEILDSFQKTEFWYVDAKEQPEDCAGKPRHRSEERWWLPVPCVPKHGLSEAARRDLRQKHDCASQIHKAAMAINNGVLAEIEMPELYIQTLPKCGRASVGDLVYRNMSFPGKFSPEPLLDGLEMSSEHGALEVADRIEAAMHVWRRKASSDHPKSPWNAVKDLMEVDKNVMLANRSEDVLLCLKQRFPGLSQTTLDASKIQYNKDVGQAILESYSRVLESLAYRIVTCIDDVLLADGSDRKL